MPIPYDTIEKVSEVNIPAWQETWPGIGECGPRYVSDNEHSSSCPSSTKLFYEPVSVSQVKDQRKISGRTGDSVVPFRMTPRKVSKITNRQHLVKVNHGNYGITVYHQHGDVHEVNRDCTAVLRETEVIGPATTEWREVSRDFPWGSYTVSSIDGSEIAAASIRLQQNAALASLMTWDLLTDVAESREIPKLFGSTVKGITKMYRSFHNKWSMKELEQLFVRNARVLHFRQPKTRLLKDLSKRFMDEWMQYRYGIMPLVYSMNDIKKVIDIGFQHINRKTAMITPRPTGVNPPGPSVRYKWMETVGSVKLAATVRSWYTWDALSRLDTLGFNPLVTAWELIPYSFVFDWFVNMGDYIARSTTQSLAREQFACISQRDNYTERTWVHLTQADETISFANGLCYPWIGGTPPVSPSKIISNPEGSQLLNSTEYDSYTRVLFPVNAASLTINPSLNWRRAMDSAVMAHNLFTGLVRRFR